MNPILAMALLGLSAAPAAPVPKEPAPNPFAWAYMGVRVQNVVDGDNAPLQISAPEPGTPAYKAGLLVGDVLVKIGAIQPLNFEDVQRRVPCVDRLANTIGHAPGMKLSQILDDVIAWKRAEMGRG